MSDPHQPETGGEDARRSPGQLPSNAREAIARWRGLTRPWKTFTAVFAVALVLFILTGLITSNPLFALASAAVWGGAAGSVVYFRDRLLDMWGG